MMMESIAFILTTLTYFVLLSGQCDHVNALGIQAEVNYTTNQITPTNLIASAKQQTEFASTVNTNHNTLDGNVNKMIRINELDESANITCNGTRNANAGRSALLRDDSALILSERGADRFATPNPRRLKNFAAARTNEAENNFKLRRARKRRSSGRSTSKVGKSETPFVNETVNSDLFLNSSAGGDFSDYIFIKDSQNISDNSSELIENQIAFHESQLNFSSSELLHGKNDLYNDTIENETLTEANRNTTVNPPHPNRQINYANSVFANGTELYGAIRVNDEMNVIGNDSNFMIPRALNLLFARATNFRATATESTGIMEKNAPKNNKSPAAYNEIANRARDNNNSGMNLIKKRPPEPAGNKGDGTPKSAVYAFVPPGEGKTLLSERNKRKSTGGGVLRGSKSMMIKRDRSSAVASGQFIASNEIASNDQPMSVYTTPEYRLDTTTSTLYVSRLPHLLANHPEEATAAYNKIEGEGEVYEPKRQEIVPTTPVHLFYPATSDYTLKFDHRVTISNNENVTADSTGEPEVTLEPPLPKGDNETEANYVVHYSVSNKTKSGKTYSTSKFFNIYKDIISCANCSNGTFASGTDNKLPGRGKVFGIVQRYKNATDRYVSANESDDTTSDGDISFSSTTEILNADLDGGEDVLSASTEVTGDPDGYLTGVTLITDGGEITLNATADYGNETYENGTAVAKVRQEFPWPVKKEAVVEGDLVLGGLMMIHEREDMITCGPVMPQGGIQALEAMLYTLDRLNEPPTPLLPNITLGAHILDDCDKDTYGLEMAVDFIKENRPSMKFCFIQIAYLLSVVYISASKKNLKHKHRLSFGDHYPKHKYKPNYFDVYDNYLNEASFRGHQNFDLLEVATADIEYQNIESETHHRVRHHHDLGHPDIPWPVKKEAVVEGDIILGGLMMVHEREDTVTCGPVMPQGGIQALEAMLYTLDRLNEGPRPLIPNITLGVHILDDCDKDTYGLEMAVDFIKGSISNIDGAEYHCNKTQVRKVISGVVGAASSVTSIQVANLLRLFKIPQVSYFSTSPELTNKQRFEFFSRTIPSDHYQVKAMVDIVKQMGWSYISIIYEESNYGIKAFEELEDLLAEHNICIAVKEKLVKDSGVADESAYDNIVQKLLTKPRARGAIIFGSDQEVAGVMRAVRRSNATGSFSWIGSDGWSARSLVSDGNEAEVEGTLSVQPQANPVIGFEEYFLSLNVENNRRNPWFVEFWEHHFQCRYPNSSRTPYNLKYTRACTGKEKLTKQNTVFEDQLQFVSDAVMAFGYAIKNMHQDLCHGKPGLCDAMKPTKGTELLKYLRKVNFTGLSRDEFHFDINGDGPARYNIIHFKQVSSGKYRWVRVGEYLEGKLRLNMSDIQFKLGHPKPPESVCSLPCDLGQAKKYVEGESCCWHCFNCTQYQIRHPLDETQCMTCRQGTVPDPLHVRCTDIPEEYLRPDSGWAIGAMALSSTGILITMFVCGVFIRHNDTPVVRASGRELSYVLLAGILMCYCVTFALVLRPSDIVCGVQRFGAGFCFTVVYAALLTKTNRISRIFNAGKRSAKRPSFISPRSQLIICSGLVGVQVLINGVWMVISPARAIHHYPTREDNLLVCSSYIDASYMIAFTYPIFLIIICTVYAVLTRKIPEAFNESKHIGFTMYTTCVIWLAFVPLYFGTANHVALRITSMSVTISLSASVTVACLFSPKLYIILIRPERNVRQSMMPMRYSAISKNTGTPGSGSVMATVMVTAATCNQKQQIQKHVPPIEADILEKDELEESKSKPEMKDCETQTIPPPLPPTSNNSALSNSQEHLQKMNNNCNVGNGPLALLPGTQIKDFSL